MAETQIFKDYKAFKRRKNKDVNGVSEAFAKGNPSYVDDNKSNRGCWNCAACQDSWNCEYCTGCVNCWNCKTCDKCTSCVGTTGSNHCSSCDDCIGVQYSSGLIACKSCYECSMCQGVSNVAFVACATNSIINGKSRMVTTKDS